MVMSMQGTVYRASNAYSHWGASTTGTGACITVNGPIDVGGGDGRMAGPAVGARAPAVAGSLPGVKGPIGTPVHTASDASLQYNGGHYGNYDNYDGRNPRTVFGGPATIIMGIINGMAGRHELTGYCKQQTFAFAGWYQAAVDCVAGLERCSACEVTKLFRHHC
jgi:hypothetical protein